MSHPNQPVLLEAARHRVSADLTVRLLALELGPDGDETYHVAFRPKPRVRFRDGRMRHRRDRSWDLVDGTSLRASSVVWASPDEVFRLALGDDHQPPSAASVTDAAPHWPEALTARLTRRYLSGCGIVAFDARWALDRLISSPVDQPLVLVDATRKLGLTGLTRASSIVRALAAATAPPGSVHALARTLHHALELARHCESAPDETGEGRLIGESTAGELEQVGEDLEEGCHAAMGAGPLLVHLPRHTPLGLGLGPLRPSTFSSNRRHEGADSVGSGAVVGEVDPGGTADRAGVRVGMALKRLSHPDLALPSEGPDAMPFEDVLAAFDARRAEGGDLTLTFLTAAPVDHHYAVEMAASAVLAALATVLDFAPIPWDPDVGVDASFDALCGPALLWREATARLFVGEPGSVTSAHTDMCPQLQLAHGLWGTKFLGIASHDATPRLHEEHADDDHLEADASTFVSTDRPLTPHQTRLLSDPDVSIALLRQGDLALFDSGALHFASNGADGLSGALYHGLMTPAGLPRLRLAASRPGGSEVGSDAAYRDHLFAADLLDLVERQLARDAEGLPRPTGRG